MLQNGDNFGDILLGSCLTVYQDSSKTVKFVIHCADYGTKSLFSLDITNNDFYPFFTGQCDDDTQFTCLSGERQCIPKLYARNGYEDCSDGSDEYSRFQIFPLYTHPGQN